MPPLVLITLAWGAGIALAYAGAGIPRPVALGGSFFFLIAAAWSFWRGRRETPLFLLCCFCSAGCAWAELNRVVLPPDLKSFLGHYVELQGTVAGRPVVYPDRAVFILRDPVVELGGEVRRPPIKIQAVFYPPASSGREGTPEAARPASLAKKLLPGDRVMFRGRLDFPAGAANPGDFDYREYLARRGVLCRLEARDLPLVLGSGEKDFRCLLLRLAARARLRIERGIEEGLPDGQASFLKGVLLGAKEEITPEDQEVYRRTGVMHLFAVSGLHLGFVLFFFLALAGLLRLGRGFTFLLTASGLLGYAALVGFPSSVNRAAVMGLTGTAAHLWHRRKDMLASLALAAFVILLCNPGALLDPGFQLSFAATWGIFSLTAPLGAFLPLPRGWKEAVAIPLAAQLAVLPLTAFYFQQISLLGLVANILVVPLAGLVVNLGLAGMLLSLLHGSLGGPFFTAAGALALPVQGLLGVLAGAPGGALAVPAPPWCLTAAWFALLALFGWSLRAGSEVSFPHFRFRSPARRWLPLSLLGLVLTAFWLYWGPGLGGAPGRLRVTFINVGQGDAVLLEMPNGRRLLVDGGGKPAFSRSSFDPGRHVVVPYLTRQGIRRLDLVVNSHPHEDHLGGLLAVLENLQVKEAAAPPVAHPTPLWLEFEALLEEKQIPLHRVRAGAVFHLDPRVEIAVIHPPSRLLAGTRSDLNNNSLVLHVKYGSIAFLLPGDIEQEGMAALEEAVRRGSLNRELLQAVVLKAPHHGSATSISQEFAGLVRPEVVVVCVGPNPFGHPAPEALRFWEKQKAKVMRTDLHGALTFETDGKRLLFRAGFSPRQSVAEADSDGPRRLDQLALRGDAPELPGGFRKGYGGDLLPLQGHHEAGAPFQGKLCCGNTEAGGKHPVEGGG